MKRYLPLLTAIVFAGSTALMAQAQSPTPRSKPDQPSTAKPSAAHEGEHAKESTADQKAKKEKLDKLSGAAFDKEFVNMMVTNHKANIPNFEREASRGSDPDVKQFASSIVPTLKEHL